MSVESGFDDLQSAVDAEIDAMRKARGRRDAFRTKLPTAEDVIEVFPTGSLARGTHKDPIHDVDLVVVYDPDAHPTWGDPGSSALEALEHTRGLVNEKLGTEGTEEEEVRLTRLQNHAVKCFLDDPDTEGAFTVDATPALRHPERGIWIPEQHSSTWVRSDPERLNDLVAGRHAVWNQFAKLVRVLKRWNSDHGAHMKSLVIEVLALDHLPDADRATALARFFAAAQEAVWSPVCDPAGLCGEIQPDMDRQAASSALASAADTAARAVEADARGEGRRAMCLWRDVFGDIFPEPFGGCGAGGVALVPAVPKRKVVDAPQG
jgi:predicted nucleotidyltransferase